MRTAIIALEDGRWFRARAFAGEGEYFGELVFNTSMTGYQEILTDPSYHGQIVTMTYPLIGNYGINREDVESAKVYAGGLVVSECSRIPSNWRSRVTLGEYLERNGKIGVDQVDTRAVTLHIRTRGAMKCVISTIDSDPDSVVEKARRSPGLVGRDLSTEVTTPRRFSWPGPHRERADFGLVDAAGSRAFRDLLQGFPRGGYRIAVLDCGVKLNQLRILASLGCELEVFPNRTPAEEIIAGRFDGFFVTNGPGDPGGVPRVVETVRRVIHTGLPTFGICFGHQLIGLALGGKTYKLKFGHHGGNQPIRDLRTGRVLIASENHGFAVDRGSLPEDVEVTHINLNDGTVEGLRHRRLPLFSVQFHPEACPGPHDAVHLFAEFLHLVAGSDNGGGKGRTR
ncbi:MAG TPA: glutamine-hydrolyzing carbamoyl-phosphate synthase small subunit [Kiritimatiellae bacterium]|nr:glutamine-hydrolyzing carbamoyl-phosphate synthase small subunit [Kiritimatiellia bacterium]